MKEKYFKKKCSPEGIVLVFLDYYIAFVRKRFKGRGQLYAQSELPSLWSFSRTGTYIVT
jgi:hypothetical protein